MQLTVAPGSTVPYRGGEGVFTLFKPMLAAADGLTLSQVCAITGLEPSTLQNWVKRGFVPHPVRKKYNARSLARILLIAALRDGLPIEEIGALMTLVNGDTEDTGDDIVPEEEFYDLFCDAVHRFDASPDGEGLTAAVAAATAGFTGPPDAAARLKAALAVMVCAWLAGHWKSQAEERLSHLTTHKGE